MSEGTCAVIVTHQPDADRLSEALGALAGEVQGVVIVDDASADLDEARLRDACPELILRRLAVNRGIAAAQNEGMALARSLGHAYVLLLDQDSIPRKGTVACLRAVLERLRKEGPKVACVGATMHFPGEKPPSPARPGAFEDGGDACRDAAPAVECDVLLSSGSLVPLEVVERIGGMEEALFIDHVDTEWCLRARSRGYRVFRAPGAVLEHRLGESALRFWAGRWWHLPRHKPFRYYYIFRNTILVSRRRYAPWSWILTSARRLAGLFLVYGLFAVRRRGELAMMAKGLVHGFRGITGRFAD